MAIRDYSGKHRLKIVGVDLKGELVFECSICKNRLCIDRRVSASMFAGINPYQTAPGFSKRAERWFVCRGR